MAKRYIDAGALLQNLKEKRELAEQTAPELVPHYRMAEIVIENAPSVELEDAVRTYIYDEAETHHGCTVQVLKNRLTGEVSIGWWKE